jgi:hypothetical protein
VRENDWILSLRTQVRDSVNLVKFLRKRQSQISDPKTVHPVNQWIHESVSEHWNRSIALNTVHSGTYDHRLRRIGHPVRSASK